MAKTLSVTMQLTGVGNLRSDSSLAGIGTGRVVIGDEDIPDVLFVFNNPAQLVDLSDFADFQLDGSVTLAEGVTETLDLNAYRDRLGDQITPATILMALFVIAVPGTGVAITVGPQGDAGACSFGLGVATGVAGDQKMASAQFDTAILFTSREGFDAKTNQMPITHSGTTTEDITVKWWLVGVKE